MATDEPKRTADDLLKAYARKRRADAGAPVELHPAARKLLQDEVARSLARPATEPGLSLFVRWRLRLVWGGVALAVVVVAALMVLPPARQPQGNLQLAQTARDKVALRVERPEALLEKESEQLARSPTTSALAERRIALADTAKTGDTPSADGSALASSGDRIQQPSTRRGSDAATLGLSTRQETGVARQKPSGPAGGGLAAGGIFAKNLPAEKKAADLQAVDQLTESSRRLAAPGAASPNQNLALVPTGSVDGSVEFQNPAVAYSALNEASKSAGTNARSASLATPLLTSNEGAVAQQGRQTFYGIAQPATATQASRFVQLDSRARYRRNFNSPAPPSVLTSFQIERVRNLVRIVDADRSTYEGQVSTGSAEDLERKLAEPAAVQLGAEARKDLIASENSPKTKGVSAVPAAGEGMNYAFRAAGTNLSLQQLVVFYGEFVASPPSSAAVPVQGARTQSLGQYFVLRGVATPSPAAATGPVSAGNTSLSTATPQSALPPVADQPFAGVIRGKVVVGGSNEFTLEAVPAR